MTQIPEVGIFPPSTKNAPVEDYLGLITDFDAFENYSSVESDDLALVELQLFCDKGYLAKFDSLEACREFLGKDPVLSKLAMITKTKNGKVKRRLVVDCRRSGLVAASKLDERILLPRVTDAVEEQLDLLSFCGEGEEVEWFVLDFVDAFWQIHNRPEERYLFSVRVKGTYFVYLRTAQGSKNAPLTWGRIAALVCRVGQSLFDSIEVRLRCYVDDPNTSIRGTRCHRNRCIALPCHAVEVHRA